MEVLQSKDTLGHKSEQLAVQSVHPRGHMASEIIDTIAASEIKITRE